MIIFLSYAKEDSARVGQIYKELKEAGYQPWMDNHDISPGQDWGFAIQNAISTCDVAIIFLSSKSVSKTGYVQVEIAEFLKQRERRPEGSIYLIPVRLDPCAVPARMADVQYADLFEADGWDRVTASLEKAKRQQSLLREQGEKRGTFTVFTRVMEEEWDGLPGYFARLSYPELRGGASAQACEELNHVFKADCLSTLHELRSNRVDQNPSLWEDKKKYGIATYKTIQDYRIAFLSESALSIVFTSMVYTGGVHENYRFVTENFALQPVVQLQLASFFKHDYRKTLGLLSREALKKQSWERSLSIEHFANIFDSDEIGKEWLVRGTTFEDNIKVYFTFSGEGLTLYFAPYEVAHFAAGSWEVTLPYYDLREILRPNGLHRLFVTPAVLPELPMSGL
jgi:TIR domain-containing protein/uncharacterized protein DUF3298/peptidoglycan-N-acetylmuramic acid deacetylase PdaC-like protein